MNELLALVVELQERIAWKLPFIEWSDCRKYRRQAKEYRDGPDSANHARHLLKTAEECRRRAIELGDGKLMALMNGLRKHAPELLPLVPDVDFAGKRPADLAPLVQAMRNIEAGLRSKRADTTDTKTDTEKKPEKKQGRALSARASACGLAFIKAKKRDPGLKLKPFVEGWASENDSVGGIYKSLLANPEAYGKTDK